MKFLSSLARLCPPLALLAATALVSSAQTTIPASVPDVPAPEKITLLDPFTVSDTTKGYMATNAVSGTAMDTALKDLPLNIDVLTKEILEDMNTSDLFQSLSMDSSISEQGRQESQSRDSSWTLRGFIVRQTLVDGVPAGDYVPQELVDRIEVVKGPTTLYGQNDPGGLINIVTKKPEATDQADLTVQAGDHGVFAAKVDANVANDTLGLRVIGGDQSTEGFRVVDGNHTNVGALSADYKLTKNTTIVAMASVSNEGGIPVDRSAYSFQLVPTDLNHDGAITNTVVGGVNELTARYNNSWMPWDYTSETRENGFTQENRFFEFGVHQYVNSHINIQYQWGRTTQTFNDNFREYNTFSIGDDAALPTTDASDANHSAEYDFDRTDTQTLNTILSYTTGPFQHSILVGYRYEWDFDRTNTYALRTLGTASEKAALANLIAQGSHIRLYLTQNDVLSADGYWNDDVPTTQEIRTLGTRLSTADYSETWVGSGYVTDSVSTLQERLNLTAGVRYIDIRGGGALITGASSGPDNKQSKTVYEAGAVYHLFPAFGVYANTATGFIPNSVNPNTNLFFPSVSSRGYEGGVKFDDLWSGRIGGTVSVFDIRESNVVNTDYDPVTFANITELSGDESKGYETELFINLTKNWNTVFNFTELDARIVQSQTASLNLRLTNAAPDRLTSWTSYNFTDGVLQGLRLGGGVIATRGPIQQFGTSSSRLVVQGGYTVFNLFARYETKFLGKAIGFGVNIDNLTNKKYLVTRAQTDNPRQITFSASLHF